MLCQFAAASAALADVGPPSVAGPLPPPGIAGPPPPCPGGPPCFDPIGENLIPPELIMAHQNDIGLSDTQRSSIESEIFGGQAKFFKLQPQLQNAMQGMAKLLQQSHVDETRVMAQLEKVLAVEREIKRTQLGLMIRIKNILTAEQQAHVRRLRAEMMPHP